MHPVFARGGRLALYVGGWVLIGVLLAGLAVVQVPLPPLLGVTIFLPLATAYGFLCLSSWYVARSAPLATTGVMRIATTAVSAAAVSSVAWVLVAELLVRVARTFFPVGPVDGLRPMVFAFGLLLYLLSLTLAYVLAAVDLSREAERRGLEGRVLAREAELRSLRAQIDPHFLFNSLHSISALTGSDPAAARRMCLLLADFLRDSLALGAEGLIPLARELALARRFLEIEQIRFGHRLRVAIDGGNATAAPVPPLLLQPLVENAVTHGIAHVVDGGTIAVTAVASPLSVTIAIENPCDKDRPRGRGAGVGLANVRGRLRALYGDEARVSVLEDDGTCRVEVVLPAAPPLAAEERQP